MVRTVICPSKMFSPFNCERKLVICYSAIYYSQTSGSRLEQFLYASIDSDIDICEASGSDLDTESSEQVESEHAVSLQFVVVSALVTLACPSELSGLKKVVTRVDVVFVFFSGINSLTILLDAQVFDLLLWLRPVVVGLPRRLDMTKLKEPKDFFI